MSHDPPGRADDADASRRVRPLTGAEFLESVRDGREIWIYGERVDRDASGDADDAWAEEAPVLAGIAAASVQGLVAVGPRAGARVRRCGDPPEAVDEPPPGRCQARQHGFDLHAGIVASAGHRERLERLCRYALRPPVAQDRLRLTGDGEVWLTLRHRWSDGTTHLRFDAMELLERLAALTPRPRVNLILYHGVLAPPRDLHWGADVSGFDPCS